MKFYNNFLGVVCICLLQVICASAQQIPESIAQKMKHAEHNAHGTNTRDGHDRGNNANGFHNNEEFDTIQDENQYRDERGPWPGRPADYHRHDHSLAGV